MLLIKHAELLPQPPPAGADKTRQRAMPPPLDAKAQPRLAPYTPLFRQQPRRIRCHAAPV